MARLVDSLYRILQGELRCGKIDKFHWVDSSAALCWIRNDRPWKVYFQNRIKDILSLSSREEWYYCPGPPNPADLPSRGKYSQPLSQDFFWWKGPKFLKLPTQEWPSQMDFKEVPSCVTVEKDVSPKVYHALLGVETQGQEISTTEFGTKTQILRVYAWVYRFIDNLKGK